MREILTKHLVPSTPVEDSNNNVEGESNPNHGVNKLNQNVEGETNPYCIYLHHQNSLKFRGKIKDGFSIAHQAIFK